MSSTASAHAHALPDTTHVASVRVGVRDLERSLAWYDRWFGLVAHVLHEDGVLGLAPVGGQVVLELVERPDVQPFGGQHTGLYHFALRVPERVDLARWLAHAAQQQLPLVGAADHFVSEAVYLTDPDGHGIEIYWDRPRSIWDGQVHLMTTASLDINDLFGELDTLAINSGTGRVPAQTDMGHVHLQVAYIDSTVAFLRDVVGFELMMTFGRQAVFLATGGYHHDVGANTWSSRGAPPAPDTMAHLERVTFSLPDAAALEGLRARIAAAGVPVRASADLIEMADPSGNRMIFRSDTDSAEAITA
jgi:catechol 2,3-dioxygenase